MYNFLILVVLICKMFLSQASTNTECNVTIPSDLVFLVDESGSVNENNQSNFEKQMQFIANFISGFKIGPRDIQVGLVTYSTDVKAEYYLNTYKDLQNLQQKTLQVTYNHPGLTFTDTGLDFVRQEMFTSKRGDRPRAANVIIVLTDGESSLPSETVKAAKKVHDANFTVFAIGIGNKTNRKELETIASDPRRNVFVVTDFSALHVIQGQLQRGTCNVIKNQPTTRGPSTTTTTTTTTTKLATTPTTTKRTTTKLKIITTKTTTAVTTTRKTTTTKNTMKPTSVATKPTTTSRNPKTQQPLLFNTNTMTMTMTMPMTLTTTMRTSIPTTKTTKSTTPTTKRTTTASLSSSIRKPTTRQQFLFTTNTMTIPVKTINPISQANMNVSPTTQGKQTVGGNNTGTGKEKVEESILPGWFSYLEIGIITAVSVLVIGGVTCCCHRLCCAALARRRDDEDEEEKEIEWKKNFRDPVKKPININVI